MSLAACTPTPLAEPADLQGRRLVVRGVVQGVGFRPHVARLAALLGVRGSVWNDATSVVVEAWGAPSALDAFGSRLVDEAPPLASVSTLESEPLEGDAPAGFRIVVSTDGAGARTEVPPDTAPCAACLAELDDPTDRRYRHPFITCTHCGPRLSIITDLPYDRPATTMAGFAMCEACRAEYADPTDRRFHAQPIACHDCGPTLRLHDRSGAVVAVGTEAVLAAAAAALRGGLVVAIKGVGGYHLACDATSAPAVAALRERKHRPDQPFAVLTRDLDVAATVVEVGGAADLLASPQRPIVLLPAVAASPLVDGVAPGLDEVGVLLPYAPLHHLLLAPAPDGTPGAPPLLVMTSGNVSGEPLCVDDEDALARLGGPEGPADLVLAHDRPIAVPVEDSVIAWSGVGGPAGGAVPVRRSRGWAPQALPLPGARTEDVVLAAGAETKNTVTLVRDGRAYVSGHVGDLASLAAREHHQQVTDALLRFHRAEPDLLVADLHPGYASRAWAQRFAGDLGVPVHDLQHHHAHLASVAAEHGRLDEPVLGLVLDGTGYGCDGSVWGGEVLLLGDGGTRAERLAALGTVRLPGGDAGVRHPVRTAALALLDAGVDLDGTPVAAVLSPAERTFLERAHASGQGFVETSSTGRLFDVVASLLDVRHRTTYDAQAAIELESTARRWHGPAPAPAPFPLVQRRVGSNVHRLDVGGALRDLATRQRAGEDPAALALALHTGLAAALVDLAADLVAEHDATCVGLSGGVWVNRLLLGAVTTGLGAHGIEVLTHRVVPCTDGGLSLGQAAVGAAVLARTPAPT
ncbi:carbamoyltransferase HypF [Nocardioides bruguierae]|uniref:carbamoyltransferase HypF n=1 Tax=Nocardioides bruguierae TaxID=2945102 RepID=UPI00202238A3|nr:carbamoyltransferase HypF [Nocardioides bruguierae]MCL8025406.1 carbamoyltransferase HypF [Nocardioides bruguierae]